MRTLIVMFETKIRFRRRRPGTSQKIRLSFVWIQKMRETSTSSLPKMHTTIYFFGCIAVDGRTSYVTAKLQPNHVPRGGDVNILKKNPDQIKSINPNQRIWNNQQPTTNTHTFWDVTKRCSI
jgi:hypothetical protein